MVYGYAEQLGHSDDGRQLAIRVSTYEHTHTHTHTHTHLYNRAQRGPPNDSS